MTEDRRVLEDGSYPALPVPEGLEAAASSGSTILLHPYSQILGFIVTEAPGGETQFGHLGPNRDIFSARSKSGLRDELVAKACKAEPFTAGFDKLSVSGCGGSGSSKWAAVSDRPSCLLTPAIGAA